VSQSLWMIAVVHHMHDFRDLIVVGWDWHWCFQYQNLAEGFMSGRVTDSAPLDCWSRKRYMRTAARRDVLRNEVANCGVEFQMPRAVVTGFIRCVTPSLVRCGLSVGSVTGEETPH